MDKVEPMLGRLLRDRDWGDGTREHGQRALSRLTGIGLPTVQRMFQPITPASGESAFKPETLTTLAEKTGIPLDLVREAADYDRRVAKWGMSGTITAEKDAVVDAAMQLPEQEAIDAALEVLRRRLHSDGR